MQGDLLYDVPTPNPPPSPQKNKNKKTGGHFVRACTRRRGQEAKNPYRIAIKFCTGVGVPNVINHAKFSDQWFRGSGDSGVEFLTFPLTFVVVLETLWHYRASVRYTRSLQSFCRLTCLVSQSKWARTPWNRVTGILYGWSHCIERSTIYGSMRTSSH